jgi:two-component system, cell cycle response regulator DivK
MAGECILVIEDNGKNRKLVRDVLQFHGYAILEAETAEAGIQLAQDTQPALILMDVQLPGMDGLTAMRTLRADERTRHIPIIALTALAMKGDQERLLASGFDGYIDKPITLKMFLATIQQYLPTVSG